MTPEMHRALQKFFKSDDFKAYADKRIAELVERARKMDERAEHWRKLREEQERQERQEAEMLEVQPGGYLSWLVAIALLLVLVGVVYFGEF